MTYYSKFQEDVVSSTNPPADPIKDQLWWKMPDQTLYIWDGALWILNRSIMADDPSKAPIESPVFTGNPRAPTPAAGDADTSVATTAFVKNALDSDTTDWTQVVNKPVTYPPTLPITQSGVTNLEADLALKAPKDNPIFTGNPQAPTPLPGDNDTSIATTAFVALAAAGVFPGGTVNQYLRGDKSWQILNKAAVGLGNVDNTADLDKPVSVQQANADALRVLKSGDTMSGQLTISPPGQAALLNLLALGANNAGVVLSTDAGPSSAYLESRTGILTRWQIFLGDNTSESGIPAESGGSNFALRRFRNDGAFLSDVITVRRSDGIVDFAIGATAPTPTPGDSSTKVATTAFVTSSIGGKEPAIIFGTTSQYWRGDKSWQTLDKTAVGLGNVDNTSDLNKPISTATQTALNLKASIDNPVFTGKVTTAPSALAGSGFRIPHGVNPTAPVNGDLWSTSTGFYGMVNGVVVGPMGPGVQGIQGPKGDKGDKGDPGPLGGQVMYIGDGPPAAPVVGQTWFEADTGNSFIYYDDGTSIQWVPTHVGALPGAGGASVAWADITGKPATYPPTLPIAQTGVTNLVTDLSNKAPLVHTHAQADIVGLAGTLSGKSDTGHVHSYSSLTGIPATFPATAHVHSFADVTGLQGALDAKASLASPIFTGDPQVPTQAPGDNDNSIASTGFVTHALSQLVLGGGTAAAYIGDSPPLSPIFGQLWWDSDNGNMFVYYYDGNGPAQWVPSHVGLPAAPGGGGGGGSVAWVDITGKPSTYPPSLPIAQSGITNLTTDLAGKAASVHTHTTSQVTGLDTALSGKEPSITAGTATLFWRGNKTWGTSFTQMTQAAYDGLGSKDANTLYVIIG